MDEQNQIEIPESFMALYCRNGRPVASRPTVEDRYDFCEDLATQASEACRMQVFKADLAEEEILKRCRASLDDGDLVTPAEADWVVRRVAELLSWSDPMPVPHA